MANPFSVAPLGGLQTYANIGNTIGAGIQNYQAEQQQQALQQKQQALQAEAQRLMREGTPQEIAAFSAANPEIGKAMQQGVQFASEQTRQNMQDSMQRVIAGEDPVRVIQERAEMVRAQGGDPSDTMRDLELAQQDPEAYREMISRLYAMRFGTEGVPGMGGGPSIGTYNPRDYTTQSFAEFQRTGDPSVLQRYESSRIIDVGGVPHMFNPADRTITPGRITQSGFQATGQPQPYQDGSTPTQQPEGREITATDVAASQAEITAAEERAKQEVKEGSPKSQKERREAISKSRANIASTADVVSQVDSIIDNENYLDSLTGVRGVLPAAPGTPGYDATVALDRLKNSLTLGNLDKMSGVLSESDIKILASEAGGLEAGMSRESMVDRLTEIRSVFQSKTEEERKKLREMMKQSEGQQQSGGQMSEQDADAFINSVLGQ